MQVYTKTIGALSRVVVFYTVALTAAASGRVVLRNVTTVLLDTARAEKGIESDYALAKVLGVRQQTVSNYRCGRAQMDDEIVLRLADLLNRPAAPLLAELAAERAKQPDVARTWREAAVILRRVLEKRPRLAG